MDVFGWLLSRFKEGSSWASIGAAISGVGTAIAAGVPWYWAAATGVASLFGFSLADKGKK